MQRCVSFWRVMLCSVRACAFEARCAACKGPRGLSTVRFLPTRSSGGVARSSDIDKLKVADSTTKLSSAADAHCHSLLQLSSVPSGNHVRTRQRQDCRQEAGEQIQQGWSAVPGGQNRSLSEEGQVCYPHWRRSPSIPGEYRVQLVLVKPSRPAS